MGTHPIFESDFDCLAVMSSRTHLTSSCATPPAVHEGYYQKKRKWPLRGYHKRYFLLTRGLLVYGKSRSEVERWEKGGKYHGKVDLGLAAMTRNSTSLHLDAGYGQPIHIKPLRSKKADFQKLLDAVRAHKTYRNGQNPKSPGSTLDSRVSSNTVVQQYGALPIFSEMASIDENMDKFGQIEKSIEQLEAYIVRLTQIRAEHEEVSSVQTSPKKISVAGKMKNSIRRRHKGSTPSSEVTSSLILSESDALDRSKSASQPDLTQVPPSCVNNSTDGTGTNVANKTPLDVLRDFEQHARGTTRQLHDILAQQKMAERKRSLNRDEMAMMELRRENHEHKRILQQIQLLLPVSLDHIDKAKSRMSFRNNSLERHMQPSSTTFEESINGSTRDLFFDCEEELYMSGDDSSDEEQTDSEDKVENESDSDIETETEQEEVSTKSDALVGPIGDQRRQTLPVFMSPDSEVNLLYILKKNIGKDLTKVSMPVSINQPLSALQRIAEELEYSELLDEAARLSGVERMIKVCVFALSTYAKDSHRPGRKPFNPILGETYELVREDKGVRFIAEQVSHHPPVSVAHCEGTGWELTITGRWKNKFWGRSMEIHPLGQTHIVFKDGEEVRFNQVTSCIHNILSGEKYVEFYGECIVKSTAGLTGRFTFQRGGWMSASKNEVIGEIKDKNGTKCKSIFGRWDEAMYVGEQRQTAKCVWRQHALPQDYDKYYGFTRFAIELNELIPQHKTTLPHTDSRWRPDQRLLESGELDRAEEEKKRIESIQRSAAATRQQNGISYQPRLFVQQGETYRTKANYWEERDKGLFWANIEPLW